MRIITKRDSSAPRPKGALEPGFYESTIMKAYEETDNKGNEYMQLEIRIETDSRPIIKQRIYNSEKSLWRFEQLAAACGWKFKQGATLDIPAGKFVGYRPYVVTYRRRDKDGNGIYTDILHFLRKEEVPHPGIMSPEEMREFGLNEEGESLKQLKAAAARNNGAHGGYQSGGYQQGSYNGGGHQSGGYQQPQQGYRQPAQAPVQSPDEEEDDIPF